MNKPVYLDLPILELSRIVMYEFWYDYIKPKHGKKKSNYITWIQTALQSTQKQKTFTQRLRKMLKLDFRFDT